MFHRYCLFVRLLNITIFSLKYYKYINRQTIIYRELKRINRTLLSIDRKCEKMYVKFQTLTFENQKPIEVVTKCACRLIMVVYAYDNILRPYRSCYGDGSIAKHLIIACSNYCMR